MISPFLDPFCIYPCLIVMSLSIIHRSQNSELLIQTLGCGPGLYEYVMWLDYCAHEIWFCKMSSSEKKENYWGWWYYTDKDSADIPYQMHENCGYLLSLWIENSLFKSWSKMTFFELRWFMLMNPVVLRLKILMTSKKIFPVVLRVVICSGIWYSLLFNWGLYVKILFYMHLTSLHGFGA